jgi:hypothetical protein
MKLVPLHLKAAQAFIRRYHRHSLPTVGGKFALGAMNDVGQLVGVAVCGRPIARHLDDGRTLEVLRVCTDGTLCGPLHNVPYVAFRVKWRPLVSW